MSKCVCAQAVQQTAEWNVCVRACMCVCVCVYAVQMCKCVCAQAVQQTAEYRLSWV